MEDSTRSNTTEVASPQEDLYVFVKFLGHGSFGRVNLYRNSTTNTLVVWKEIDLKKLDAKLRNEAFAEVEILSMLNHPNIISYYKHFIVDDTLFIELEYAKAGTLYNLIKHQQSSGKFFEQETVLWYLYQLTCAVDYIHELGIMHRDIKAMNIFLMTSGLLKLGDFGIAKFLDPNIGFLESQVGTPMYLSPEIVEGKKYSTKSDIWALGCVAHELVTLRKVFEATNQLKLALKISICDVHEINNDAYSSELRQLVKSILSKNADERPSAKEIRTHSIFSSYVNEFETKIANLNAATKKSRAVDSTTINRENSTSSLSSQNMSTSQYQNPIVASKLSEVYTWGGGKLAPKQIEVFRNENAPLHLSCGSFHYAVINAEKELFTACHVGSSNSSSAKLGHCNLMTKIPRRVDALSGINIEKVTCGDEMTFCLSEDGDLFTFGTNINGCLGVGASNLSFDLSNENSDSEELSPNDDPTSASAPVKLLFFEQRGFRVKSIACGDLHCIALTTCNRVFTWGCGEFGRLGHGDEDDRWEPTELTFKLRYTFRDVYAGSDFSFLLTNEGKVLAFGNNEFNKLCLNQCTVGLKNADNRRDLQDSSNIITQQLTPKIVKNLSGYDIFTICPGQNHSAVIDEYGRLFTFGSNRFGQLGVGDCKKRSGLNQVGGPLVGLHVTSASCGDSFTICSTSENLIFSWGNRQDGRLGLDGAFDDSNCVCLPKPIFGTLYLVSEMSCKGWNTMIIAEKMLNSKSMRSISYADYLRASKTEYSSDSPIMILPSEQLFADSPQIQAKEPISEVDEVPEWLKNDLADADFIPLKPKEDDVAKEVSDKTPTSQIKSLEEALEVIANLTKENLQLKEENKRLLELSQGQSS